MTARFVPTPEQAAIIGHPATPVRVSAGAGTGKTTTIVERLSAQVAAGGDPARALGITFTNKAADELRDRLRSAIGPQADGREVEVATYHSFAASILDEFGSRIGHRSGAVLMDEGHRFELAGRVLRSLEGTALDLTKIPSLRKDVLMLADGLTSNLLDAEAVVAVAPRPLDETWTLRLALLEAAGAYQDAKAGLGLIEYADLIRSAVTIVSDHPDVRDEITRRYDAVLLDEYQDTDPAQRMLLTALFSGGTPVTAVGDTDQTIYEWRGASIQNFEAFPEDFPDATGTAPTLPLSVNRRSDRRILDLANRVREHLPSIEGALPLRARDDAAAGGIETAWFPTAPEEASWIAARIRERYDDGVPFAEVAVLARRRNSLREIADALRDAAIPYTINSTSDLLEVPEIADLVAWLDILADPTDEPSLLRVLMGGRYGLGMADVASLARSDQARSGEGLISAADPLGGLADLTDRNGAPITLSDPAREAIRSFARTYRGLFARSQAASVPAIIDALIDHLDFWAEVAALAPARATTVRLNVSRFIDLADRWHPLDGVPTLSGFLRYLDALAEPGRAEELDRVELPTEDAVTLSTVHGAKGLEWDEVYLPDVARTVFPSRVQGSYYDPLTSAVALPYRVRLDATEMADVDASPDPEERRALLKARHDAQEWRLAYVAVTRARHQLIVSGHAWHADNKTPREPSRLLELAASTDGARRGPFATDPGPRPTPMAPAPPVPVADPLFPDGWAAALRRTIDDSGWITTEHADLASDVERRVEQLGLELAELREPAAEPAIEAFSTSVTGLVTLAECPLKFRWMHHDRLPRRPRRSAREGTEFHRRIEMHHRGVVRLDTIEPEYDDAPGADHGDDATARVDPWAGFATSRFFADRPRYIETPFEITLEGRTLRGKVDAVYEHGSSWEIVDYKSGRPAAEQGTAVQLEAYAVAAAAGALGQSAPSDLSVTFAWFGTSPPTEETAPVDAAWLAAATDHVTSLLRLAETGPFPAEPSAACRWCDFLHHCAAGKETVARG